MRRLQRLSARLRAMSLAEVTDRLGRVVADELRRWRPVPTAARLSDAALMPQTPWQMPEDRLLRGLAPSPGGDDAWRSRADRGCAGDIVLWGAFPVALGLTPDWHRDPITGRRAPRVWFTRIPYLDPQVVGDHKGVWEVNRLQWLLPVATALAATGEARYRETLDRVLRSWLAENPPYMGVNWTSALEVAFRLISITAILDVTGRSAHPLPVALQRALVDSVAVHARYIADHLSTWFAPNTHLTGEALALLMAGTAWPALPDAAHYRAIGWRILVEQGPRHLRPDGSYFEQSSWYLGYTVDFYVEALLWGQMTDCCLAPELLDRVRRGVGVLRSAQRPDGGFVCLGDDDGGALWNNAVDGAATFSRTIARAEAALGLAPVDPPSWGVSLHQAGGIVRLDDWTEGTGEMLLMDAGPQGTYGHAHDDPLTIDLTVGGRPIITDPGTGSYMDDTIRPLLRGATAHGVLEHRRLSRPVPRGPFGWTGHIDAVVDAHGCTEQVAWCSAHTMPSLAGGWHRRLVLRIRGRFWLVLDVLGGAEDASGATLGWSVAAGVDPLPCATGFVLASGGAPTALLVPDPSFRATICSGRQSPGYGVLVSASRIQLEAEAPTPTAWVTLFGAPTSRCSLERLGPMAWAIEDTAGRSVFTVDPIIAQRPAFAECQLQLAVPGSSQPLPVVLPSTASTRMP